MNSGSKHNIFEGYIEAAKKLFGIITLIMLLVLLLGELILPDERDKAETDCKVFEAEWQQILKNGEKVSVEVPGKIPAEYGEVITLTTTLPKQLYTGEVICFRAIWQDVKVYIDGQLRQNYCTENTRAFGTNSATRYVFVELYEEDEGKELTYQFSSDSKYAGRMLPCYIGDRASVWIHLIMDSGARTVLSIFLLLLCLFCIIVCGILRMVYKKELELKYLAWALFFCALWMLSESEIRQLVFKNVSLISNYPYWSLMWIPIPLMIYINEIQKGHYKKVYIAPMAYSVMLLIIGTILQVLDIAQFVQRLMFIHVGLIYAIICIVTTIIIDAFKKRISDYLFVGIGILGLLLSTVLEIVLYYTGSGLSIGTMVAFGLMFLLIMAIIKSGQDLLHTEQKKQQAIMAREAQAKFLANMSHEIRTPINAIIGMNEMVLRENENETVKEYAQNIQSASNMLLGLVNDILDFSKIEAGQLELVEATYQFVPLMQAEILLLNARINGKPLTTKIEVSPDIPTRLFGDELRIKQVLTNLLSNAVKYTKEGTITLKAFSKQVDKDNVVLYFAVTDTGIGIKEEDLSKLFSSFKRLELNKNRNIEGTGLGLNIAKQLVNLMQGDITVESEYGKGSTFTVSIPQRVMDRQPIGSFEEAVSERKKENHTSVNFFTAPDASILVVDDNAVNRSVMRSLLKRIKIQVDLAAGGRECINLTKQKKYDIILMDHMMPELDGVETLHVLRNDETNPNHDTVVIALTANAIAGCREMYLEYGFNDYFAKPIQADKLDTLIFNHLPETLVHKNE